MLAIVNYEIVNFAKQSCLVYIEICLHAVTVPLPVALTPVGERGSPSFIYWESINTRCQDRLLIHLALATASL